MFIIGNWHTTMLIDDTTQSIDDIEKCNENLFTGDGDDDDMPQHRSDDAHSSKGI